MCDERNVPTYRACYVTNMFFATAYSHGGKITWNSWRNPSIVDERSWKCDELKQSWPNYTAKAFLFALQYSPYLDLSSIGDTWTGRHVGSNVGKLQISCAFPWLRPVEIDDSEVDASASSKVRKCMHGTRDSTRGNSPSLMVLYRL